MPQLLKSWHACWPVVAVSSSCYRSCCCWPFLFCEVLCVSTCLLLLTWALPCQCAPSSLSMVQAVQRLPQQTCRPEEDGLQSISERSGQCSQDWPFLSNRQLWTLTGFGETIGNNCHVECRMSMPMQIEEYQSVYVPATYDSFWWPDSARSM